MKREKERDVWDKRKKERAGRGKKEKGGRIKKEVKQ